MKNILYILPILLTLAFLSCENLSKPEVYEKAYLKATISDTSDTIKVNVPLNISLTIPNELHTINSKTYTLTSSNVKKQIGYLISSKENGDSSTGYFNSYNGFLDNGEWKLKVYFDIPSSYPHTYNLSFTPKDTGLYYISFNYSIDIQLKDADKSILISTYTDFDVINKHEYLITNKYPSWEQTFSELNTKKIGSYAFYVIP